MDTFESEQTLLRKKGFCYTDDELKKAIDEKVRLPLSYLLTKTRVKFLTPTQYLYRNSMKTFIDPVEKLAIDNSIEEKQKLLNELDAVKKESEAIKDEINKLNEEVNRLNEEKQKLEEETKPPSYSLHDNTNKTEPLICSLLEDLNETNETEPPICSLLEDLDETEPLPGTDLNETDSKVSKGSSLREKYERTKKQLQEMREQGTTSGKHYDKIVRREKIQRNELKLKGLLKEIKTPVIAAGAAAVIVALSM